MRMQADKELPDEFVLEVDLQRLQLVRVGTIKCVRECVSICERVGERDLVRQTCSACSW